MKKPRHPQGGGCWYFITASLCPVCGDLSDFERTRRWTKKPKKWEGRHEYYTMYCGCEDYNLW